MRQILFNLLSNAVGFSKPGDTVGITCRREGGMMVFAVEDQGVGIPKDQQWKVFDRFESRSHGSSHRGAGLGPVDRQKPCRAAWRHRIARIRAGARARASLCAFPSTAGLIKHLPRTLPQEGPEGPLSAGGSAA